MIPAYDPLAPFWRKGWQRFTNATSETIPPFAVMVPGTATRTDGELVIPMTKPATTFVRLHWVNGPQEVLAGKTGWATTLADANYAMYDTGTPAVNEEWGAKSGQWSLSVNRPGFLVRGGPFTVAGQTVVAATQQEVKRLIGKADSTGTKGGSAITVSVWMGAGNSEAVTEYGISAFPKFAAIATSKFVGLEYLNGNWYVLPLEC